MILVAMAHSSKYPFSDLPFTPVTLSFKDIWYTVTIAGSEKLDLLQVCLGLISINVVVLETFRRHNADQELLFYLYWI